MTIEEALVAHLKATAALVPYLGNGGKRLYPGRVPDVAGFPRLVYMVIEDGGNASLTRGETPNNMARIQMDCQGQGDSGHLDARNLAEAVAAADGGVVPSLKLQNWIARRLGGPTGLWVQGVTIGTERRGQPPEIPTGDETKPPYTVQLNLLIHYLAG